MFLFIKNLLQPKIPNAAIAWQQLGNANNNAYWLYAAPVHLVLQRDTFSLAEPVPLVLNSDESNDLTASLNKHFGAAVVKNKISFFWHQDKWFLRLEHNPNITTHAPQFALNKAVGAYLPAGEGAVAWASFTNEIQMLLFEHPVNQAREAKSLPAVNSIWCYGGGQVELVK